MSFPPPGYDDETTVPQQRLKFLLGELEGELNKIQQVFQQYVSGQFQIPLKIENEFSSLRASAEELSEEYSFLIDKLIRDYEHFRQTPEQNTLNQIFSDVKSLQLLLMG